MSHYRYDKLNALIHLQNQKAHYRRILEAKKNINFKAMRSSSQNAQHSLIGSCEKNKERQRLDNNFKLLRKIEEINSKNGLLQNMNIQAKKENSSKNRKRLLHTSHTFYGINQNSQDVERQNEKMVKRLIEVKASIGSQKQWNQHFATFKSNQKKLKKYSLNRNYDPENHLRDTLSTFHEGNIGDRLTIDRLESLTRKHPENESERSKAKQGRTSKAESLKSRKKRKRMYKSQKSHNMGSNQPFLELKSPQEQDNFQIFPLGTSLKFKNKSASQKSQQQKFKAQINEIVKTEAEPQQHYFPKQREKVEVSSKKKI